MIVVNCPMKQDFIIEEIIKKSTYTFIKKEGISMFFESSIPDNEAIDDIKALIRATEIGKVLYFSVESRN